MRGLKVSREPRELLKLIPGVEFIEMEQANWCCGGAGSYCFLQEDKAEHILQMKLINFVETEADTLATSCPACMMQLGYGFKSRDVEANLLHPMELLDKAIDN